MNYFEDLRSPPITLKSLISVSLRLCHLKLKIDSVRSTAGIEYFRSSVSIEIALSKRKFTAVHRCQTCVKQNNMRDAGRVYVCEIAS